MASGTTAAQTRRIVVLRRRADPNVSEQTKLQIGSRSSMLISGHTVTVGPSARGTARAPPHPTARGGEMI